MATNLAFEILYRDYYVRVYGLCRKLLGADASAEDATQEVFMRAYRNFDAYDASQPFWRWIASIANNYCIDLLRKRTRTRQLFGDESQEMDELASSESSALDTLISQDDARALEQAIAALPDKHRIPLVLAYYSDYSYDEIAAQLSITRNHVGVLLLRAKQHLRASISQEDDISA